MPRLTVFRKNKQLEVLADDNLKMPEQYNVAVCVGGGGGRMPPKFALAVACSGRLQFTVLCCDMETCAQPWELSCIPACVSRMVK